jgi:carboxyl-terminal processing protease
MPQRNVTIIFLTAVVSVVCYQKAIRNRFAGALAEALSQISRYYVEPVDDRRLFEGAMQGMVQQLDPYSAYIGPQELNEFQETLEQQFGGVGIIVEINPQTQRLTVLSPLVGTPAYEAGMRAGDTVLAIDGESTEGFSLEDAVRRMRGPPDTPVRLEIMHKGEQQSIQLTLTRAIIHVDSVLGDTHNPDGSWSYVLEQDSRIGYIRIINFGDATAGELRRTLGDLAGRVEAVILDLRGNAGGLLTAAVETSDMFLEGGAIVSTRGRSHHRGKQYSAQTGNEVLPADLPLAILVDRYTASASEILTACLQDHGRAVVVGQRSWGKGTVQNVLPLESGNSALKLTTATYWRPSGKNIHRGRNATDEDDWGVRPDPGYEVVLSDEEFARLMTYRRQRDFASDAVPPSPSTPAEDPAAGATPAEPSPEAGQEPSDPGPMVDRQLQRAVEYLQQELAKRKKAA